MLFFSWRVKLINQCSLRKEIFVIKWPWQSEAMESSVENYIKQHKSCHKKVTYRFFVSSFQFTKNAKCVFVGSVQIILWILLCFLFLWRNDQKYSQYVTTLHIASLFLQTAVYILVQGTKLAASMEANFIGDNFYDTMIKNWPSFTTFKLFFRWWKFARLNLSRLVGSCWENNSNQNMWNCIARMACTTIVCIDKPV